MNLTATSGLPRRDGQLHREVPALHLIKRVRSKVHRQKQIACWTTCLARHALTGQPNHLAGPHTHRNLDAQGAIDELRAALRIELHGT